MKSLPLILPNWKVIRRESGTLINNPSSSRAVAACKKKSVQVITIWFNLTKILNWWLGVYDFAGKTATFSIALLQRLNPNVKEPQVLVLSSTRELAMQIHKVGLLWLLSWLE